MTVTETAARLGRSVWTVYRLIHDGLIRATKIRGTYTVNEESVNAYLTAQTNDSGSN